MGLVILSSLNISHNAGLSPSSPFFFDSSAPSIDVWYGDNQVFGSVGTPQQWVNILGNVSDPESGIALITYRLNGVSQLPNPSFTAYRRLQDPGDFNIEINKDNLLPGSNTVRITVTNGDGLTTNKTVNLTYVKDSTWYLPYTVDWSTISNLQDVVQVVDGYWEKSNNGIRSVRMGYDRLLDVGDMIWQDYEVKVPITLHDIDEDYYNSYPSTNPGVGLIFHWLGHTDNPDVCSQPLCGWLPNGAFTWYEFKDSTADSLFISSPDAGMVNTTAFQMSVGQTYWFKARVEKNASGNLYRFKVWQNGQSEPSSWTLSHQTGLNNLDHGSVLLVAHHVDVTFGGITILPLNGSLTLTTSTTTGGSIQKSPNKSVYQYGELVTLTAVPATGYVFDHWSGDIQSSQNPSNLIFTDDMQVMATFTASTTTDDHKIFIPSVLNAFP
jgi:hypothetical protein